MIVGLYYDLIADYATQLWEEIGLSCARYSSLIFQQVYEKERILIPDDVPKVEFGIYQHPKTVEDDSDVFHSVARILDATLRKVDLTNPILVAYLTTINHMVAIGVLLPTGNEGISKCRKISKKSTKVKKPKSVPEVVEKVTKPIQ